MRFFVVSWLVAGVMIGASGCDVPQEGPEAPPLQDPAEQPVPGPVDQPAPGEPQDWEQPQGAASEVGTEPAAFGGYEMGPMQDEDPLGSDALAAPPSLASPVEQPAPQGAEPWDEPQSAPGFDAAPAPHPAEPAGATDAGQTGDRVFSAPALPSEITDE